MATFKFMAMAATGAIIVVSLASVNRQPLIISVESDNETDDLGKKKLATKSNNVAKLDIQAKETETDTSATEIHQQESGELKTETDMLAEKHENVEQHGSFQSGNILHFIYDTLRTISAKKGADQIYGGVTPESPGDLTVASLVPSDESDDGSSGAVKIHEEPATDTEPPNDSPGVQETSTELATNKLVGGQEGCDTPVDTPLIDSKNVEEKRLSTLGETSQPSPSDLSSASNTTAPPMSTPKKPKSTSSVGSSQQKYPKPAHRRPSHLPDKGDWRAVMEAEFQTQFWNNVLTRIEKELLKADLDNWMDVCLNRMQIGGHPDLLIKEVGRLEDRSPFVVYARCLHQDFLQHQKSIDSYSESITMISSEHGKQESAVTIATRASRKTRPGSIVWAFVYLALQCLEAADADRSSREIYCTRVVLTIGVAPALISFYGYVLDSSYKNHSTPLSEFLSPDRAPGESPIVALAEFYKDYLCHLIKVALWLAKKWDATANRTLEEPFYIKAPLVDVWLSFDRNALHTSTQQLLDWIRPKPTADEKDLHEKLSVICVENDRFNYVYSAKSSEALRRFHSAIFSTKVYKDFTSWPSAELEKGGKDQGDHILRVSTWADFDGHTFLFAAYLNLSGADDAQPRQHSVIYQRVQEGWHFRPADTRVGLHGYQSAALGLLKQLIRNILLEQPSLISHFDEIFTDSYMGHTSSKRTHFDDSSDFTAMMILLLRLAQDVEFKPTYVLIEGIGTQHSSTESWHKTPTEETLQIMGLIATVTGVCENIRWILTLDDTHWEHFDQILKSSAPGKRHRTLHIDAPFFKGSFEDAVRWQIAHDFAIYRIPRYGEPHWWPKLREDPRFTTEEARVESEMPRQLDVSTMEWVDVASFSLSEQSNCLRCDFPSYMSFLAEHCPTLEDLYAWSLSTVLDNRVVPSLPSQGKDFVQPSLSNSATYYGNVFVVAGVAYRGLSLAELAALSQLPPWVNPNDLLNNGLRSVLSYRRRGNLRVMKFESASSRTYVARLFPRFPGQAGDCSVHIEMARRCLCLLLGKLQCKHVGFSDRAHDMTDNPIAIGYSVCMWLQHYLDATCCDSHHPDVLKMVEHVLSLHLPDWLAEIGWEHGAISDCLAMLHRFLEASLDKFATTENVGSMAQDYQSHNDDLRHEPDAFSTVRVLREAISILLWHDKMSQARQQAGEDNIADVNAIRASLSDKLLFTPGFNLLKRDMFPDTLPWLAAPPILATDAVSNECTHDIIHQNQVASCSFSPDGRLVASTCNDNYVRLWSTETGLLQHAYNIGEVKKVLMVPKSNPSASSSTKYNGQESLIAVFTMNQIRLLDTLSGRDVFYRDHRFTSHLSLAVSPRTHKIAISSTEGLNVYDYRRDIWFLGAWDYVETVTFSSDGRWMAYGRGDGIIVRDMESESLAPYGLWPYKQNMETTSSDTARDGSETGAPDGYMKLVTCLAFSPDSRYLASGSRDLTVRIWDLEARRAVAILFYHSRAITSLAFSPGGMCLVAASADNFISIWIADESGKWYGLDSSPGDNAFPPPCIRTCPNRVLSDDTTGKITSLSITPYSPSLSSQQPFPFFRLASTSLDDHLRIWDIDISTPGKPESRVLAEPASKANINLNGTPPRMEKDPKDVTSMAISPNGEIAATGHFNGTVCFWSTTTGERLSSSTRVTGHVLNVCLIQFSPDGLHMATVGGKPGSTWWWSNSLLCVWDVPPLPPRRPTTTPGVASDGSSARAADSPWPSSASPSAERLASSTAPLPNANMSPRLVYFPSHIGLKDISFSHDSRLLAALDSDGHALIFDIIDGRTWKKDGISTDVMYTRSEHRLDIYEEQYALNCCAFSPDGEYLAVGTGVGYLLMWSLADRGTVRQPESMQYLDLYSFTAVAFSNDGSTIVAQLDTGRLTHFGIWTVDRSVGAKHLTTGYKLIRCTLNMPWTDCQIRVDTENYPGIIFTEHGAICADLTGKHAITDMPKAGTKDFHYRTIPDQYPVASLNTKKGREVLEDGSSWNLPFCGVYDDVFRWNDKSLPLPAYLKPKEGGFKWCVQGRVVMVACKGGVLIFHASEDALPTRRDASTPQPDIEDQSDSSSMSDS